MEDADQPKVVQTEPVQAESPEAPAAAAEQAPAAAVSAEAPKPQAQKREDRPPRGDRPAGGPKPGGNQPRPQGVGENRDRGRREERKPEGRPDDRRGERREGRPGGGGGFRPDFNPEIDLDKLINDSLYLDNQAHVVVARMRDMDSGTKSQLRRLYGAVRRAVGAPESERQHQFVMLRARLAYTTARHSLRSLDALERLLLQVTRKNDTRGYQRFKDLFEAIVAYNE